MGTFSGFYQYQMSRKSDNKWDSSKTMIRKEIQNIVGISVYFMWTKIPENLKAL
jgi:hypothetical protein